jgi:hypothetical protein
MPNTVVVISCRKAALGRLDGVLVDDPGLLIRAERALRRPRFCRRIDDVIQGRLHSGSGEMGAIVEIHVLAQLERVAHGIRGHLPTRGKTGVELLAPILGRQPPHERIEDPGGDQRR